MQYRTMIIFLDQSDASRETLAFSLGLASLHGAHLTALYRDGVPDAVLKSYGALAFAAQGMEADVQQRRLLARQRFEAAATAKGVDHSWFLARDYELEAVVAFARDFDLVIASRFNPDGPKNLISDMLPERLLLGTGRPVLLVPAAPPSSPDFSHVVLAWNGSRESARALADALPFFRRAERITLIAAPARNASVHLPPPDLVAGLRRHEIEAGISVVACEADNDTSLKNLILTLEPPADLLVAGAYGHNRVGEILLGGATRTLLTETSVPLLMSH